MDGWRRPDPVPLLDVATISGLQIKMLADLSKLYGMPFGKERAKVLVGSLLGSVLPSVLANSSLAAAGTVIKIIPVIGTLVGMAVQRVRVVPARKPR